MILRGAPPEGEIVRSYINSPDGGILGPQPSRYSKTTLNLPTPVGPLQLPNTTGTLRLTPAVP